MKKNILIAVLLILIFKCNAQNLILNSDMEQYSTCPTLQGQSNYAGNYLALNPSSFATDYLNSCATNGSCDVPTNYSGFQIAHSGVAYSGIYLRQSPGSNVKEYIEGTLSSPLIPNRCYHFEMYINLGNICQYTSDAISVYFSDTAVTGHTSFLPLTFVPQINSQNGNFPDTTNWTLVSGDFTAAGGEQYFIIGCFVSDAQMNELSFNPSGSSNSVYVYVDDISLVSCANGIENKNKMMNVSVFPNPANEEINFTVNSNERFELTIYDITSRVIFRKEFIKNAELNISQFQNGIYLYKIQMNNIKTIIGKFEK